CHQYFTSPYSF
nr:immunoglobulin light chain junction region [Macaca mulatta]MOX49160.1 immunoglobulin light chain junction region [Macaca mulatta]MOX49231.1 immunoglobulin light chain junction region [Macaca mulatta]